MEIRVKTNSGKVLNYPGKKHEFDEFKFWQAFLGSLNIEGDLKDTDIKMMSFILSQSPHKSYFKKPNLQKLLTFMGYKNYQATQTPRTRLIDAKLLEFTGEVRGDYLPSSNLRKLQIYIKELLAKKELDEIEIVIPVKIVKK